MKPVPLMVAVFPCITTQLIIAELKVSPVPWSSYPTGPWLLVLAARLKVPLLPVESVKM